MCSKVSRDTSRSGVVYGIEHSARCGSCSVAWAEAAKESAVVDEPREEVPASWLEGVAMHRHDRLDEHLATVPLFEGLSNKQLRHISQLATELDEPAGTVLIHERKIGHEFIVVLEGEIEVTHDGRVLGSHGVGSYVGEIALLEHRPRTATVVRRVTASAERHL